MRVLKIILITLVSIILLLVVIGFFLPTQVHIERERTINASPNVVYGVVNDLRLMGYWDAWSKMDPTMKATFEGPETGVGSIRKWDGEKTGKGTMTITESVPNEKVLSSLDFGEMGTSTSGMFLSPENEVTKMKWTLDTEIGSKPFGGYMAVIMKGMLNKAYDEGLERLDSLVQTMPKQAPVTTNNFTPEIIDLQDQWIVGVRNRDVKTDNIATFIEESYGKIGAYLGEKKIEPTGPPGLMMHKWEEKGSDLEAFMPVSAKVDAKGDITSTQFKYKKAVRLEYYGDYEKMEPAYGAVESWMSTNKVTPIGPPWEVYITDPMVEKDTAKWQTSIFYPIE